MSAGGGQPIDDAGAALLAALCKQFKWRTDGDAAALADRIAHHIRDLKACIAAHEEIEKHHDAIASGPPSDDGARVDWIEKMLHDNGAVWFLPCGPELRSVQIRTPGKCHNGPTVYGVRNAIDAVKAERNNIGKTQP